ncbi:tetratricopeptide repeat protein [Pseudomonas sp. BMS12]|uniref:tetratricopeptide repeat protein n=1 Tax=Pseudomonas sp. BMS12 TaxID=1796033 RepID=UPI00083AB29E|nr:tetratricopeptide repeat protein [Pseudomonas sp. BMS12]
MTTPDSLEKLLAKGVDNALLRFGLGKSYLDADQPEAAAEHLQKCLGFDPNYSAAWKLLGHACQRQGMLEEARQAWHNGLEVARKRGDKQTEKEMTVFLRRLEKHVAQQESGGD